MSTGSPGNVTCQSLTTNVFSNQSYKTISGFFKFIYGQQTVYNVQLFSIPQDGLYEVIVRQITSSSDAREGFWGICNGDPTGGINWLTPVGGDVWMNNDEIASHFGYVSGDTDADRYRFTLQNTAAGMSQFNSANLLFQFTSGENLYFYTGVDLVKSDNIALSYTITVRYLSSS